MMMQVVEFILGILYANAGEWFFHKYVLHQFGKKAKGFWRYHLYEHHRVCNQNNMIDPGYRHIDLRSWNTQSQELFVLMMIILLHSPLFWISPLFTGAIYLSIVTYYIRHRKAHLDREWAKKNLRWHYEHHLGEG